MSDPILQSSVPSGHAVARPAVVGWYKAYLGFLVFLFLLVVGAGVAILFAPLSPEDLDGMPKELMAGICIGGGLVMLIPSIIGFFLPRSKGASIFHLVMICIGLTGCTLVFSIPLLIFWIKPEVKDWYTQGRQ